MSTAATEMETTVLRKKLAIATSRYGSPRKAIRKHCLWCANTSSEVRLCPCTDCALWPFRFGRQPEKAENAGEVVDPTVAEAAGWREDPEASLSQLKAERMPSADRREH